MGEGEGENPRLEGRHSEAHVLYTEGLIGPARGASKTFQMFEFLHPIKNHDDLWRL
jgi:hypothetical protein